MEGACDNSPSASEAPEFAGKMTFSVFITCVVAASGGLIFGYDMGIMGGVTTMQDFLNKFFPAFFENEGRSFSRYCLFDGQILASLTSSLYLAGFVASFVASTVTRLYGRKPSMFAGGVSFLTGSCINGGAENVAMLIVGRIMLGVGVGFASQSVPVYLSEMALPKYRGALNNMFPLAITLGFQCATLVNYGVGNLQYPWGWRLSLGLGAVPAAILTVGSALLPETPHSMIEHGEFEKGHEMLQKIRGVKYVDAEYDMILQASKAAWLVEHPWRSILKKRYRPHLVMAIMIPLFQQLTGINAIVFYGPLLLSWLRLGFIYTTLITGGVSMIATFVSIALVDRIGRRKLFLEGGVQMFISQVVIGAIFAVKLEPQDTGSIDYISTVVVVVMICLDVLAYAWSWGPLGWLVPSEIFPIEIRSAGQAISVSVQLLSTFVFAQAFTTMLCHFKYGIYFFFAGWVVIMSLFICFCLPETKNVPIEEMEHVWRAHPLWRQFIPDEEVKHDNLELNMQIRPALSYIFSMAPI